MPTNAQQRTAETARELSRLAENYAEDVENGYDKNSMFEHYSQIRTQVRKWENDHMAAVREAVENSEDRRMTSNGLSDEDESLLAEMHYQKANEQIEKIETELAPLKSLDDDDMLFLEMDWADNIENYLELARHHVNRAEEIKNE